MSTRKLLIALATAGLLTGAFGSGVFSASAQPRTFVVTIVGGQSYTVTVDAPPGVPASEVALPPLPGPVLSVTEILDDAAPAPAPSPSPQPAPPADQGGQGGGSQPAAGSPEDQPVAADEEPAEQRTTGKKKRQPAGGAPQRQAGGGTVEQVDRATRRARRKTSTTKGRTPDGVPTIANPTISIADPGAAPIGVPNFFISKFEIPPFLLSIYQAAGIEYGVPWTVLASINSIETDFGRNLNVSSAGALGWMQFMPATWKAYGVDANGDKRKDPYNPVDAIFSAARYLKAAGAETDLRKAIFAYNHADWYVDMVVLRAKLYGGIPANLVSSLTGLTHSLFPVAARARYADDISEREATRRVARGRNAAMPVEGDSARRGINIYAKPGAPVVAVQDGRIVKMGRSERLGRFVQLRDAYGNTYTYAHLKKVADRHPVPKRKKVSRAEVRRELDLPKGDPKPTAPASAGTQRPAPAPSAPRASKAAPRPSSPLVDKERLFANPKRPNAFASGGDEQLAQAELELPGFTFKSYFTEAFGLNRSDVRLEKLRVGSKVIAGTILGRIGRTSETTAPHMRFEIRPAGRGAPRIDPKPILDGWKLLESTAIYRAKGRNPLVGKDTLRPTIGQILLMPKSELEDRVLASPRIEIYECGRRDIRAGRIDRRVLASLLYLEANGLKPTVTSLQCGHGFYTKSGNVSHHSSGNAVDIARINGIPVLGHQGKGSITDLAVRSLLQLQGSMTPSQIITLMEYENRPNTLAMSDHHDHIHLGFTPMYGTNSRLGRQLGTMLKPDQWIKLIDRLNQLDNPTVLTKPSKYAIKVKPPKRASRAHVGE